MTQHGEKISNMTPCVFSIRLLIWWMNIYYFVFVVHLYMVARMLLHFPPFHSIPWHFQTFGNSFFILSNSWFGFITLNSCSHWSTNYDSNYNVMVFFHCIYENQHYYHTHLHMGCMGIWGRNTYVQSCMHCLFEWKKFRSHGAVELTWKKIETKGFPLSPFQICEFIIIIFFVPLHKG